MILRFNSEWDRQGGSGVPLEKEHREGFVKRIQVFVHVRNTVQPGAMGIICI
jgi:hypothetical protein